ncbi:hypothetical protein N7481_010341 [Penicillium waksmanii]|uniref:uncharacterized protein n=1 Tax=Penicillium waksmanii TaxID=69791 RepID=UPI00254671EC|nr:uncharacterized protein N7481_010341 [Penicillium waksmanii]KAJ5976634.1 hypothetical protein N7481_010341 [Penicillium waksmanii]
MQHQNPSTPHQNTAHGSGMSIHVSPVASPPALSLQNHRDHNISIQLNDRIDHHPQQNSTEIVNIVDVHDMIQPILQIQAQVCEPPNDLSQVKDTQMADVHDIPQPVLPQVFGSLGHQSQIDIANMLDIHDMIQPILPTQGFASLEDSSMVDIHDMLQPILPTQACEPFNGQSQTRTSNMARFDDIGQPMFPAENVTSSNMQLQNMFPSIPPVDRQASMIHDHQDMPMVTQRQDIFTHNSLYLQPVSAA